MSICVCRVNHLTSLSVADPSIIVALPKPLNSSALIHQSNGHHRTHMLDITPRVCTTRSTLVCQQGQTGRIHNVCISSRRLYYEPSLAISRHLESMSMNMRSGRNGYRTMRSFGTDSDLADPCAKQCACACAVTSRRSGR